MAVGLTLMICYGACGCTFLTKGNDCGGGHQKLETTEERADEKDALDSAENGGRKKKRREKAVVTADGMD